MTTPNEKHLEMHEQKGGDQPLAGAQITKSEDSAVKQRQEMLDGLKSHRITKEGNSSFMIDMGNGGTVQDVRAAGKVADAKPAQGILPGEGDYMPETGGTLPPARMPEFPLPGKSDQVLPRPGGSDFPSDFSKFTITTDTSIDKEGHIVTTETRADGSTLATAQAIGSDSKLHPVSTVLREANGDTTTEKFDAVTGKKTEEIKDTGIEKTDTKFNTDGRPTSIDTTSGLTGHTDHEDFLYFPSGDLAVRLKNGEPQVANGDNIQTLKSDGASERGIEDQYYLKEYKNKHYDTKTNLWTDDKGKVCLPPPFEAYGANDGSENNLNKNATRFYQRMIDQAKIVAWSAAHPFEIPT